MRTTVDLPSAVHRQAKELATEQGRSLSSMVAELTIRGLDQLGKPAVVMTHPKTGLPVISLGQKISSADVEAFLSEDE